MIDVLRLTLASGGGRHLPLRAYLPGTGRQDGTPTVLLSPALGADAGDYADFAVSWARAGISCLVLQHPGSDAPSVAAAAAAGRSRQLAVDPEVRLQRITDVRAVLDAVTRGAVRPDLVHGPFGVAGHSLGSDTALRLAGQEVGPVSAEAADQRDERVVAFAAMSPSPYQALPPATAFGRITAPVLHLTGTRDVSPFGFTSVARRRVPFDHSRGAERYLLTLTGVGHADFLGGPSAHPAIRVAGLVTSMFWRAELGRQSRARAWLRGPRCARFLADRGTWEWY